MFVTFQTTGKQFYLVIVYTKYNILCSLLPNTYVPMQIVTEYNIYSIGEGYQNNYIVLQVLSCSAIPRTIETSCKSSRNP